MTSLHVTAEGEMLDLICYRHYGRQAGAVEAVLEANRGLADQPPILPRGLRIVLPLLAAPARTVPLIRLWD